MLSRLRPKARDLTQRAGVVLITSSGAVSSGRSSFQQLKHDIPFWLYPDFLAVSAAVLGGAAVTAYTFSKPECHWKKQERKTIDYLENKKKYKPRPSLPFVLLPGGRGYSGRLGRWSYPDDVRATLDERIAKGELER